MAKHKVSHKAPEQKEPTSTDMLVGQIAIIRENGIYDGHYLMRTYMGFVSLNDPSSTWDRSINFAVERLELGTVISLTVEK